MCVGLAHCINRLLDEPCLLFLWLLVLQRKSGHLQTRCVNNEFVLHKDHRLKTVIVFVAG